MNQTPQELLAQSLIDLKRDRERERAETQVQFQQLNSSMTQLSNSMTQMTSSLRSYNDSTSVENSLKNSLDAVNRALNSIFERFEQVEDYASRLTTLAEKMLTSNNSLAQSLHNENEMMTRLTSMEDKVKNLKKNQQTTASTTRLDERIDALHTSVETQQTAVGQLSERIASYAKNSKSLMEIFQSFSPQLQEPSDLLAEQLRQFENNERRLKEIELRLSVLPQQITSLQNAVIGLTKSTAQLKPCIALLQQSIKSLPGIEGQTNHSS